MCAFIHGVSTQHEFHNIPITVPKSWPIITMWLICVELHIIIIFGLRSYSTFFCKTGWIKSWSYVLGLHVIWAYVLNRVLEFHIKWYSILSNTVKKFIERSLSNVHRYQILYRFSHCVYCGSYFFHCTITETESSSNANTIWNLKCPYISSYKARRVLLEDSKSEYWTKFEFCLVFCVF